MDPIHRTTLTLDPAGMRLQPGQGLAQQIYAQLKEKILRGDLAASARLPTTRELALALRVSRNTVVRAYEALISEGLVLGRAGSGCFVAAMTGLAQTAAAGARQPAPNWPSTALWSSLQAFEPTPVASPQLRAFRHGLPALDLFPHALWARLQARFWRAQARPVQRGLAVVEPGLSYGEPAGLAALRELIAAYLSHSRGLQCSAEQIIITAGSQQAIAMVALALLQPGDRVGMESPGYRAAAAALGLSGAKVLAVPLDDHGLRIGALQALGKIRMVYTTPSHQYPTGVTMSLQRRLDLLAWAEREQAWVLEDDYDGEYRFNGVPLAPLASLDQRQRTLYVGSFSKLLFPGLRLGYLLAPTAWLPHLAKLRSVLDRQSSIADQVVMADFMAEGHFLRHVRRMRRAALERRDAFLSAWERDLRPRLPADLRDLPLRPIDAGLQAFWPLPSRARETRLVAAARAVGIEMGGLTQIGGLPAHSQQAGLVFGFASSNPVEICRAIKLLASAWRAP